MKSKLPILMLFFVFICAYAGFTSELNHFNPRSVCEIGVISVDKGNCTSDTTYTITFDFDYFNTGGPDFKVWVNGQYYGVFQYANLPITIQDFPKSGGSHDWIKVCDIAIPDCCRIKEFPTQECGGGGGNCEIGNLVIEAHPCEDGLFYVDIDFDYNNVGNQGFGVFGNGNSYGSFDYADLPITIGPLAGDCQTEYEFLVKDLQYTTCNSDGVLGVICCEEGCALWNLAVDKGNCTSDSTYTLTINFQYKDVGGSDFELYANGQFYGYYQYAALPITIQNFPKSGGSHDWIEVCDSPSCCAILEFKSKTCEEPQDCQIKNLSYEVSECDENGNFSIMIDFEVINPESDSFCVFGNGMDHGKYAFADLPISIGPLAGDCNTSWEFLIKDCSLPSCQKIIDLGKKCCDDDECFINEIVIDIDECISDSSYNLHVAYNYNPAQGDSIKIWANGNYFGQYAYGSPLYLENFPKSGGSHDWIKICDAQDENCCKLKEFESPNCGGEECHFENLSWDVECDGDSLFYIVINFDPINPPSDGFKVKGNGVIYGIFEYADLPVTIGPLAADCNTPYEFLIHDLNDIECNVVIELGEQCCDANFQCEFNYLKVDVGECTSDETFVMALNPSVNLDQDFVYKLWLNGVFEGEFANNALPYVIQDMKMNNQYKCQLKVCAVAPGVRCCTERTFNPPTCLWDLSDVITGNGQISEFIQNESNRMMNEHQQLNVYYHQQQLWQIEWMNESDRPLHIKLYDLAGRIIHQVTVPEFDITIASAYLELNDIPRGTYFLSVGSRQDVKSKLIFIP